MGLKPSYEPGSRMDIKWQEGMARAVQRAPIVLKTSSETISNSGTSETTLFEYNLPARSLSQKHHSLRYYLVFETQASANDLYFRSYLGSSILLEHGYIGPGIGAKAQVSGHLIRLDRVTQLNFSITNYIGSIVSIFDPTGPNEDLANPLTFKITGESSGASDEVTLYYASLELWPGAGL